MGTTTSGDDFTAKPGLEAAFAVETPEENRDLYAQWADTYESGFIAESGYVQHRNVAALHARSWTDGPDPEQAATGAVLDVGCGTGVLGVELRRLGAQAVDGVDISPEMLAKAADKHDAHGPVYRHLLETDLTKQPELPDHDYTGVVSTGAFTHGHLGPDALTRLVTATNPGTRFTIAVNGAHFANHGYEDELRDLERDGGIGPFEIVRIPIYATIDPDNANHSARVLVFNTR